MTDAELFDLDSFADGQAPVWDAEKQKFVGGDVVIPSTQYGNPKFIKTLDVGKISNLQRTIEAIVVKLLTTTSINEVPGDVARKKLTNIFEKTQFISIEDRDGTLAAGDVSGGLGFSITSNTTGIIGSLYYDGTALILNSMQGVKINALDTFSLNFDGESSPVIDIYNSDDGNFIDLSRPIRIIANNDNPNLIGAAHITLGSINYLNPAYLRFIGPEGANFFGYVGFSPSSKSGTDGILSILATDGASIFSSITLSTALSAISVTGQLFVSKGVTPSAMTNAAAPNSTIYYSSDAGKLVYKDGSGVVNNLY